MPNSIIYGFHLAMGFGLVALVALPLGCNRGPEAGRESSAPAAAGNAPLSLLDLSGRRTDPFAATNARAIVFLFISNDCPISNRYAPEIQRLHGQFAARGVAFWLVHPDPGESVEAIRKHTAAFSYTCGVLRDPKHALVKKTGVRVTPEAAVFLPGGKMVYRGRIDDRWADFGKARPAPTRRDLQAALEALLAGKPVPAATQPAIGCYISELP